MGTGYVLSCRRCGYHKEACLGIGFSFPEAYQKIVETAKTGKLGEELRLFLIAHAEGVLDVSTVLLKCRRCGLLKTSPSLSMYLPKNQVVQSVEENQSGAFSREGISYVSPWNLKEDYTLFKRYDYHCHKCGGVMKTYDSAALSRLFGKYGIQKPVEELHCPECDKALYFSDVLMWD